jgi:hypothetical protein
MAAAREPLVRPVPRVRPRHLLLVGAFVVGWSVGRARVDAVSHPPVEASSAVAPVETVALQPAPPLRRARVRKPVRLALALAGAVMTVLLAGLGFLSHPDEAQAPLVAPAVAAQQRAQAAREAESARLKLLRHLELAGIAARRVGLPEHPEQKARLPRQPAVKPSDRAIALDTYLQALGAQTILTGLDASRDQLQQQVLNDPRIHIYPAGRGDVASGKLDVRVLAIMEYLAQANREIIVSCLITGHSLYVHGRPGLISAHIFGRAVDISAVAGVSITGHQGAGSVTERAIRQLLTLPESVAPVQVISLMTLGGPSFALPDHYDHIHIGF